jgi:hypothetical protein
MYTADEQTKRDNTRDAGLGAQEDDGRENYYIGECGHRVTAELGVGGLLFYVGPCHRCDEE